MNISQWIDKWATYTPGKPAIRFEDDAITYGQLAIEVCDYARMLRSELNVGPGHRIAYLGYNHPRFLALLFACAKIGAVLVPLNFRLAPPEHLFMLRDSGATVFFIDQDCAGLIEPIKHELDCRIVSTEHGNWGEWLTLRDLLRNASSEEIDVNATLESPLLIVYTSGTTGKPKGAVITQRAVLFNALNSQAMYDFHRDDHILATLPFFHVGGLNIQTTPALHAGATVSLMRTFDPGVFLHALAEDRPTLTILVPTQILAVSEHPDWKGADVASLRNLTTGSTMVPEEMIRLWQERDIPVLQCYGCTESGPIAIHSLPETAPKSVGSVGKAAMYCDVRIVGEDGNDAPAGQPGEILLRGPNLFKEYWHNAEATENAFTDEWFHTGDIGYRNEEGYYYIVDRKTRMIISGGENVYPAELETILLEHPDIDEAVVVALPDNRWGEVAVAAIVPHAGKTLDTDQLKSLFEGRIARLKHPRYIVALPYLPKSALGKVIYGEVQSKLTAALSS